MTGVEIIKKYPLSIEVVKQWYIDKMREALNDESVSEDFSKYMLDQGVPEYLLINILEDTPRSLFDILDANDIIVETHLYPNNEFTIKIANQGTVQSWKTRLKAELFAIETAFDILEQKLTLKKEENEK